MKDKAVFNVSRRDMLRSATVLGGAALLSDADQAQTVTNAQATVRDRMWMYGQEPGPYVELYNLPRRSTITAVEAAFYFALPNMVFQFCRQRSPAPLQQLEVPFRPFHQLVWGIVECAGRTDLNYMEQVLQWAAETPNITGLFMDDFFRSKDDMIGALTVEQLQELRDRITRGKKHLDLWVVLYDHQLERPVGRHLALCDVVTFWTWKASNLDRLPANFAKAEKLAPHARRVLGCYMYDFGDKKTMPLSAMKFQCELALEWIQDGRLDGMMFAESDICDLGFDAVEWTREWIRKVGDQKLAVRR